MKSPFPGMDPYLEPHWRDLHQKLVTYIADAIQPTLPGDLAARTEERVYVHSDKMSRGYREIYPDVRIIQTAPMSVEFVPQRSDASVAVMEPVAIRVRREPMTEGFIQILDLTTDDVVTVIEVLSATNKEPGDGARQLIQKQTELGQAGIGLVEIDLIRSGNWVINVPPDFLRPEHHTLYRVCATSGWEQDLSIYYPIRLRDPLPSIKIPLRETDEQVVLELQPLLDRAYQNGRYASIDYTAQLKPPLSVDDAKWADELLRSAGKRS